MSKIILKEGVEFIPAGVAAKAVGYTSDYISKLARENRISATRVGRNWYVALPSVLAFKSETEKEKRVQAEVIRKERLLEQRRHHREKTLPGTKLTALAYTAVVLLLGLSVGIGGYTLTTESVQRAQADHNALERLAIAFYHLLTPEGTYTTVTEPVTTYAVESEQGTTTYTTLIVAPDEILTESQVAEVRDSFSDEVEISVDPENPDTGIITPIFKEGRGDEYRYLMMPIHPPDGS